MKLLLDTCTFLWMAKDDGGDLSDHAEELCRSPTNELFLSVASAWEIAVKYAAGRLELPSPAPQFVVAERHARGIAALTIDEESALHTLRLPRLHRDPFDRMLVSQAIVHGLTILTPDPLVTQYPARTIW